ncbi:hypothetical protein [Xanthomonas sp. 3498]|uniref:hypothetical protein n=1 Tax=Xanthomonas sp. 3498 TaxID=2663863 RepID=UPI00161CA366|nr:hypothetical protein [Xanthomonas sp. 3498]MBB5875889.1 hypothetical protein [Xanthomonas sp. 3498]
MTKLIKPFRGVPDGQIYPVEFAAGDECPPELEAGALEVGAIEAVDPDAAAKAAVLEQLEAAGITYDKRWGLAKLQAALEAGKKG